MTKSNFNDYAKDLKFYIPKDYIDYKYYVIHTNLFIINLFMFLLQVRFFFKIDDSLL